MIGNDIVDIAFAKNESNWKRPRFLDKIFTIKEQKYIAEAQQPEMMVWLLWSMKESAYKLHVQIFKKRFFAPKRLVCSLLDLNGKECVGRVVCDDFTCFTQSEFSDQFVYTISKFVRNEAYLSQTFMIKNSKYITQHKEVYKKAITRLAEYSRKPIHQICVKKSNDGVPSFYYKKEKTKVAISITHHGNYGAFAINNL